MPVSGRAETSRCADSQLSSHQQIDLPAMVFIVSKALVDLSASERRKATRDDAVDRLAVLQQAHNVMDADPSPFDDRVPSTHPRLPSKVAVRGDGSGVAHGRRTF